MSIKSRASVLFATASTVTLLFAGAASAQTDGAVQEVVVTGSRIQSAGFQAPTPVTVLGQAQLQSKAPTTVLDVLNEIPSFRPSSGPTQGTGGSSTVASSNVDLRGLGARRTLTLVDGRRQVAQGGTAGNSGAVDLGIIPTLMVERIDVVTGGASAAYGSDAVAGVVNLIIKKKIEGIQGTIQYGVSEHGDNEGPLFGLVGGKSFADGRGNLVAGLEFSKNGGVGCTSGQVGCGFSQRKFLRDEEALVILNANAATRAGLPMRYFATQARGADKARGGLVTGCYATPYGTGAAFANCAIQGTTFDPNSQPYAFNYAPASLRGNSEMIGGSQYGDSSQPQSNAPIKSPTERRNFLARGNFDFSDKLSVWAEIGAAKTHGYSQTAQHYGQGVTVTRDNAYLPTALYNYMLANNLQSLKIGRYDNEIGPYQVSVANTTYRGAIGAEGKFSDKWSWDASYQHGESLYDYQLTNDTITTNYYSSLYAVKNAAGQIVCGPNATNPYFVANPGRLADHAPDPGCVPMNIFGEGTVSPAALKYVIGHLYNEVWSKLDVVDANIQGTPFDTWAGPVALSFGAEWRKQILDGTSDPLANKNGYELGNQRSVYGEQTVKEAYGEIVVPLARDLAFAKSIDFNGAVRRTSYSVSGDVTTWKGGVTWDVNDAVRFRATRSRDIRAPEVAELTGSGQIAYGTVVTNPFKANTSGIITIGTFNGGNSNLVPEVADTLTYGVVLQPTWSMLNGVRLSVDAYKIKINKVITTITQQLIVDRCFAGAQEYCGAIHFDSSAVGIAQIDQLPFNLNRFEASGLDVELSYRVPLDALPVKIPGRLDIRALGTYTADLITTDSVSSIDNAGSTVPDWVWNVSMAYKIGAFTSTTTLRAFTDIKYSTAYVGPNDPTYSPTAANSINDNLFPGLMYVNWAGQYDIKDEAGKKLQVFGSVDNLFNREPPQYGRIVSPQYYDLIGRSYRVGLRFQY